MAVVPRKRASGKTVYGISFQWNGRSVWELVGPNRREAEILDRKRRAEVKAGTYSPGEPTGAATVREFTERWLKTRENRNAREEASLLRRYIYTPERAWFADLRMDEVKPKHAHRLMRELRALVSDKTIANAMNPLHLAFNAAVLEEIVPGNPIKLERNALKKRSRVEKEAYTAAEVAVLTNHHTIPWPIRVMNALCFFAGLREGEACGRRWRDLQDGFPLSCLVVLDQYDQKVLKTERPRKVPVHPKLAEALEGWAAEGFELYTGHRPQPDDFIVPNVSSRAQVRHHTRSSFYKAFVKHAESAGVRPRSLHSTRHTFISLCRRGGAPKDVLERVTHNSKGDIVDQYTHFDWEPLCLAVLSMKLDVHPDAHPAIGSGGNSGALPQGPTRWLAAKTPENHSDAPDSIPGASTTNSRENSHARQETRPSSPGNQEDLSGSNRRRRRKLLSIHEADPTAAAVGLSLTSALDEAYLVGVGKADDRGLIRHLAKAAVDLGAAPTEATDRDYFGRFR